MIVTDWNLYPNFHRGEFNCKCGCGRADMQVKFMEQLQSLRNLWNKPMIITSGFRCPDHPVEKAKSTSGTHAMGIAADIGVSGADAIRLLRMAIDAGFTGIGVQQKGAGRFIHLDTRADSPALWSY